MDANGIVKYRDPDKRRHADPSSRRVRRPAQRESKPYNSGERDQDEKRTAEGDILRERLSKDRHRLTLSFEEAAPAGKPGMSSTGRTSIVPHRAAGIRSAIRMASSRFAASTRKNPPSCSRVSAKGPSVTSRL